MLTARLFLCSCLCLGFATLAVVACGEDTAATPEADGGRRDTGTTGEEEEDGGGNPDEDGGTDKPDGSSCKLSDPPMDGGFACSAYDFGKPAVPYSAVDASDVDAYAGGTFLPGIYDVTIAERGSASPGAWQETFAVDSNGRFVRTRQITTGANKGVVTRRSGTVKVNGNLATFSYDCASQQDEGGPLEYIDAGADTLPFEVLENGCDPVYRYGFFGFRFTLRRRK